VLVLTLADFYARGSYSAY